MTTRGFGPGEFKARTERAQQLMAKNDLAALVLTTEVEVRYYTGFLTQFWQSPTRPWFIVVPSSGDPIAVIPSIGSYLMGQSWVTDIRTWSAPDYKDDGVTLLADALNEIVPEGARIGIADHMESYLRMPLSDFDKLKGLLGQRKIVGDARVTQRLRMIKSKAEITKIATACDIASQAFDRVAEIARPGVPLSQCFREFQRLALQEGADNVPYLAGAAARGGYGDVISPASDTPLQVADVLMLDTGLMWDGYFSDFDRNYNVGPPTDEVRSKHKQLIEATQLAFDLARPGAMISDLFHAMAKVVGVTDGSSDAGRFGHGLGMQLTEWPSIIPDDHTELVPGMVLTLEPCISLSGGKIMVHEEDIVIHETGAEYLSSPQAAEIRVI